MSTETPPAYYPYSYDQPPPPPPSNALAITAMVAGNVGLVLTPTLGLFQIGAPIGLIMGPTAMVVGWMGRRRAQQGLATEGGLATIGALLGLVTLLLAIAVGAFELWLFSGLNSEEWD